MSLQGKAQRVFNDIFPYINTQDYGTLITELKIGLIQLKGTPPLKQSLEIEPIRTMRLQYGYTLQRLASKAFPTISLNAQEHWVLDQFINGLGTLRSENMCNLLILETYMRPYLWPQNMNVLK